MTLLAAAVTLLAVVWVVRHLSSGVQEEPVSTPPPVPMPEPEPEPASEPASVPAEPAVVAAPQPIVGHDDAPDIRRVIQKAQPQIRRCYEAGLKSNRKLHGKIVVHFTIVKTGRVAQARIASTTMHHEKTEMCIAHVFYRLHFAPPTNGGIVNVNYPVVFASE